MNSFLHWRVASCSAFEFNGGVVPEDGIVSGTLMWNPHGRPDWTRILTFWSRIWRGSHHTCKRLSTIVIAQISSSQHRPKRSSLNLSRCKVVLDTAIAKRYVVDIKCWCVPNSRRMTISGSACRGLSKYQRCLRCSDWHPHLLILQHPVTNINSLM